MTSMTDNTRTEVLSTKVDKLDDEVRQCTRSLQDIKVTLVARDAKYDHILSLLPSKAEPKGSSNGNGLDHKGQLQPHIAMLDFPKLSGGEPTSWIYRANQFFQYQKTTEDQKSY